MSDAHDFFANAVRRAHAIAADPDAPFESLEQPLGALKSLACRLALLGASVAYRAEEDADSAVGIFKRARERRIPVALARTQIVRILASLLPAFAPVEAD